VHIPIVQSRVQTRLLRIACLVEVPEKSTQILESPSLDEVSVANSAYGCLKQLREWILPDSLDRTLVKWHTIMNLEMTPKILLQQCKATLKPSDARSFAAKSPTTLADFVSLYFSFLNADLADPSSAYSAPSTAIST
jgi:hypothetical protein